MVTLRRFLQLRIKILFYFKAAFCRAMNNNFKAVSKMKISQFLPEKIDSKVIKSFC